MAQRLKIMGVHGLGDHRGSGWEGSWEQAIRDVFPHRSDAIELEFQFVTYDDLFEKVDISAWEAARAFWQLSKSGLSWVGRRERGILSEVSERIKWTAGYVVAWLEDEAFKAQSRRRMLDAVRRGAPDVILAHSLGSLVTYNAITHSDAGDPAIASVLRQANYVTLGSQLNNPFVIGNLSNGRILPPPVASWYHLFNRHDDVFTAPIRLPTMPGFRQVETTFDDEGVGDHAAESYFRNPATVANLWTPIGGAKIGARSFASPAPRAKAKSATTAAKPGKQRKALLIGINDYPQAEQRLEGCINDVFTMSAVLQDCEFPPDSIRTCLDSRATAKAILDRLEWLVDGASAGDELVFYFSGHGARIPEYGENFEPDHHLECLVPWDFDWTPERAISDDHMYWLYSQLPYECRLIMIFDCCHSGGMHRMGGARPRGITPPDDIRHRELKWDAKTEMWVPRDFKRINPRYSSKQAVQEAFFGAEGTSERIGRASMLRPLSEQEYEARKDELAPGPYLPLIIEACGEEELSYEYRHGATSYGAFTFSLGQILRREKKISFEALVGKVSEQLKDLGYEQTPRILGPSDIVKQNVPFASGRSPTGITGTAG